MSRTAAIVNKATSRSRFSPNRHALITLHPVSVGAWLTRQCRCTAPPRLKGSAQDLENAIADPKIATLPRSAQSPPSQTNANHAGVNRKIKPQNTKETANNRYSHSAQVGPDHRKETQYFPVAPVLRSIRASHLPETEKPDRHACHPHVSAHRCSIPGRASSR